MKASYLYTMIAVGPIPPQAEKTRGEKQALSNSHHMHETITFLMIG